MTRKNVPRKGEKSSYIKQHMWNDPLMAGEKIFPLKVHTHTHTHTHTHIHTHCLYKDTTYGSGKGPVLTQPWFNLYICS